MIYGVDADVYGACALFALALACLIVFAGEEE